MRGQLCLECGYYGNIGLSKYNKVSIDGRTNNKRFLLRYFSYVSDVIFKQFSSVHNILFTLEMYLSIEVDDVIWGWIPVCFSYFTNTWKDYSEMTGKDQAPHWIHQPELLLGTVN